MNAHPANVTTCRYCRTYLFESAERCHGCGEKTGRIRLLRRGSWAFVVVVATGFGVLRGVEMLQERHYGEATALETAGKVRLTSAVLTAWLSGDRSFTSGATGAAALADPASLTKELARLAGRYPDVLPADSVSNVFTTQSISTQRHYVRPDGTMQHLDHEKLQTEDVGPPDPTRSAAWAMSIAPTGRKPLSAKSFRVNGSVPGAWDYDQNSYSADVTKGGRHYRVSGRVCTASTGIRCISIDRVESDPEGLLIAPTGP